MGGCVRWVGVGGRAWIVISAYNLTMAVFNIYTLYRSNFYFT